MFLETITIGQVAAPLISTVAAILLYHYLGREYLGAEENKYWNSARRTIITTANPIVEKKTPFTLTNSPSKEEFVGSYSVNSLRLAEALFSVGYVQGVLSGLKIDSDEAQTASRPKYESGSMVFRESRSDLIPDALALRQVHVFWFERDGSVDVYAHEEYSSLNPLVSWKHYRAISQNADKGVKRVRPVLEEKL